MGYYAMPSEAEQPQFSVYQFFPDGSYERTMHFVPFEPAIKNAAQLAASVGGRIGTTQRIIITDGGDEIVFEWLYSKGVVWPPQPPESGQVH